MCEPFSIINTGGYYKYIIKRIEQKKKRTLLGHYTCNDISSFFFSCQYYYFNGRFIVQYDVQYALLDKISLIYVCLNNKIDIWNVCIIIIMLLWNIFEQREQQQLY